MNIDEWTGEPRTAADLVQDLLNIAQEHEWIYVTHYCGRGCHCVRGSAMECPTCHGVEPEHEPNCKLAETIREAKAFVAAEEVLAQEKADALEAVSHHAG